MFAGNITTPIRNIECVCAIAYRDLDDAIFVLSNKTGFGIGKIDRIKNGGRR